MLQPALHFFFRGRRHRLPKDFSSTELCLAVSRAAAHIKTTAPFNLAAILTALFFIQGLFFIRANSPTYDEATHLTAGYSYLTTNDFRLNREHPPLAKELAALPVFLWYHLSFKPDPNDWNNAREWSIGQDFVYGSSVSADQILALGRTPNLLLGTLLVAGIGWWAYRLWGIASMLMAIALASLEPNLIAHSSLITTDIATALFIYLAYYFFWEYSKSPMWRYLAATGTALGLALASKYSAVLPVGILGTIIAGHCVGRLELPMRGYLAESGVWRRIVKTGAVVLCILFFAALVILLAYFFQGFSPWLYGFQEFLTHARGGHLSFFLGAYSDQGWWNYFVVTFLIKTPIGSLMLIAGSLLFYRSGSPLGSREALFLLLPPVLIFIATTQANVNIGLRHILPVYPFLFVLASRLATVRFQHRWLTLVLVGTPLVFTAITSHRIAPHQLAYFNEIVGGPDQAYRYLSDSNLDWGQDLKGVKAYMEKENLPVIYLSYFGTALPSYYGIRYQSVAATGIPEQPPPADKVPATAPRKILAISVYNLQDVSRPSDPLFRWLWKRQPVAKIGYSIFIYDLTHDSEGQKKLDEIDAKRT